jgi:16S rRNA (cytosine1402-N4)-methyltransferase
MMLTVMSEHPPVLLHEAIELLNVQPGGVYVDCTVGLGGHARAIVEAMRGAGRLIALDRDRESLEMARKAITTRGVKVSFHHENFKSLSLVLRNLGIEKLDGCLVDLGVSRYQLTDPDRGFSIREDGPLDMRMDRQQRTSAETLVNELTAEELAALFRRYGEEPDAARIARRIVERRSASRLRTTRALADLVTSVKRRGRRTSIHPATLVFQALRIAVNQELEGLDRFLVSAVDSLRSGGRLVAISFHSLEDRLVKRTFQIEAGRCVCFQPLELCRCPRVKRVEILTRKPVTASGEESAANPGARSAKLRAVERSPEEAFADPRGRGRK